jgi:Zn-dependent protease
VSSNFNVQTILWLVLLIPSITIHEFAHGYAAFRLGDPTAKNAGRLTLNPIKSIDPFGSILLPLLMSITGGPIFGYAKPVPYNPMYFKDLRKGEIITGFAGPASNFALALIGSAIAWAAIPAAAVSVSFAQALYLIGYTLAMTNLVLMFFNLIPIPPLDGSSIVPIFLSDAGVRKWYELQRYAFVFLFAVLFGVPYIFHVSPIGWYFQYTVQPVLAFLMPG